MICSFDGEYSFLSNFYESAITLGGLTFPTAEHAYQAAKAKPGAMATIDLVRRASTPGHAKRLGRRVDLREDWESVKVLVMRLILREKFAPGSELAALLLATGDERLVEGNTWGDAFWGCVRDLNGAPFGANHLGLLLMERRAELRG